VLARANDLTLPDLRNGQEQAEQETILPSLVRTIIELYQNDHSFSVNGPDVRVSGGAVTGIALLLHEMATNAAKYGALSSQKGHVDVSWHISDDDLLLTWRERGGPPVEGTPTKTQGFGSLLARLTVTGQLGGKISHDWDREGLTVKLSAPLQRLMA
jgi:two-component system, chemotaxis family, CheB/CheR fusion protein